MTEQQPTKDLEKKPPTIIEYQKKVLEIDTEEEESKPLTNDRANKQIKARPRYPPRAPGFFPPALDNVITMTVQLFITIWSFFTIFTSFSVASDRDDLGWIILFEIIFTYSGFAYFTYKIKRNIVVYVKFYKCISEWHDKEMDKLAADDNSCSIWGLLVKIIYWVFAVLIFPIVIIWAMWQSFRFYQDRRKNAHSEDGHTAKTDKRVYSVWALGIEVKQASMITLFIQDIPLMMICAIIGNWTFFSIYLVMIIQKIVFWMKYMIDMSKCRVFYKEEDFAEHFGMKLILIEWLDILKCYDVTAIPYSKREMELATLQEGDWIMVWTSEEEYIPDETELNHDNVKVFVVYKNKHLKETDNLVCIDYYGIPVESIIDYFEGRTKKLVIPPENYHTINRWQPGLHLTLMNDFMYERYHDKAGKNDDDVGDENDQKNDDRTNVIEPDGNKNGAELDTEVKSNENGTEVMNDGDGEDDLNGATAIDMPEREHVDDGVTADDVNNNEENVVADTHTANSNKATEVENKENEERVNNSQSIADDAIQSEDVENNETDKLKDSPVVVDEQDVNEEENDYGHTGGGDGGSDEYVQVPLTSHDEINENES